MLTVKMFTRQIFALILLLIAGCVNASISFNSFTVTKTNYSSSTSTPATPTNQTNTSVWYPPTYNYDTSVLLFSAFN